MPIKPNSIPEHNIKLNSHTLTNEIIDQMKKVLHKSRQKRTELGFTLCSDKENNLQARNICEGDNCRVEINKNCGNEEKFIGTYHTHPADLSIASANDLSNCGRIQHICIGGQADNKIRCYTWKHNPINFERLREFEDLIIKGTTEIQDQMYKKNFECLRDLRPLSFAENEHNAHFGDMMRKSYQELEFAMRDGSPKSKIREIKDEIKLNLEKSGKLISGLQKRTTELAQNYYDEKIL